MKRFTTLLAAASFTASCINYTGLEGDGTGYTRPPAPSEATVCKARDLDDGTAAAASLGPGSLECQVGAEGIDLASAEASCALIRPGFRLATRAEALRIAAERDRCRVPLTGSWWTWTKTCAAVGTAWAVYVSDAPDTSEQRESASSRALCVRKTECSCPSTCRMAWGTDGCGGACAPNCATHCLGGECQPAGAIDSGACQADGADSCTAASCDDGTVEASAIAYGTLDCQLVVGSANWRAALDSCARLGSGWRVPTRGDAIKIARSPAVCRVPVTEAWGAWTRTCADAGRAWFVTDGGVATSTAVGDALARALCIR
jgi:hypothetical protein